MCKVWNVGAPTMERFLQEVAREKPVRFTAQQLCSFTINCSKTLGAGGFGASIGSQNVFGRSEKNELASWTEACGIEEKDREKAIRMSGQAANECCGKDRCWREEEIMPPTKPFHYLYSIGMDALKPPETGLSDSTVKNPILIGTRNLLNHGQV
ncbi:rust resistance kinase Lr10-like [Fagus crenata]